MVVALQDRQRARSGVNVSTVPPRPRTRRDRAADQTRKIPAQPGRGQANSPAVNARRAASTSTTVITRPLRLHPRQSMPSRLPGRQRANSGCIDPRPIGGRQPLRPNGSRRPAASRCTPIPGPAPAVSSKNPVSAHHGVAHNQPHRHPAHVLQHDAVGPAQRGAQHPPSRTPTWQPPSREQHPRRAPICVGSGQDPRHLAGRARLASPASSVTRRAMSVRRLRSWSRASSSTWPSSSTPEAFGILGLGTASGARAGVRSEPTRRWWEGTSSC